MQQYNSKYFACSPHPSKIQLFQNMVVLHIKGNRECSNMVGKDLGGGVKMSIFFSEHGHVVYQIDPRPVPDPLGGLKGWDQMVKIQFFQNMVMLHIKLKGITDAATW